MKIECLHQKSKEKCILFMNGWGCDINPFLPLESLEYDVYLCYDYRDILPPKQIGRLFESYHEVHLVAWSLGVYISNLIFQEWSELFASKIAINGSLKPIDELEGIPPVIFQGTIDGLNEKNLEKFWIRMCDGRATFNVFQKNLPVRNLSDQKEELITLQEIINKHVTNLNLFDYVLISTKDRIFPFENLKNAWRDQKILTTIEDAHFCFYRWNSWDKLMNEFRCEAPKHQ